MPLQIPICAFDAKTGILCSACNSKLRSGQISDVDIRVSRALVQLAGRLRDAGTLTLVRSFNVDGTYLLELQRPGEAIFRNNHELSSELEKLLGGRVCLARASSTDREFIEDLLQPDKVLSLSTVWLPDGTKIAKATIAGRTVGRRTLEVVRKAAREARGMDLVLVDSDDRKLLEPIAVRGSHP